MSLNRHNPFVASLSTLVEPTQAAPGAAVEATAAAHAKPATFLERLQSWAAFGQSLGAAPDAPAADPPDEATIQARARQLFPYYY